MEQLKSEWVIDPSPFVFLFLLLLFMSWGGENPEIELEKRYQMKIQIQERTNQFNNGSLSNLSFQEVRVGTQSFYQWPILDLTVLLNDAEAKYFLDVQYLKKENIELSSICWRKTIMDGPYYRIPCEKEDPVAFPYRHTMRKCLASYDRDDILYLPENMHKVLWRWWNEKKFGHEKLNTSLSIS
jgi:hypothetical protein